MARRWVCVGAVPHMPGIRRSLVIGDVLWTVSDSGLQANSLSTMDKLSWLPNA